MFLLLSNNLFAVDDIKAFAHLLLAYTLSVEVKDSLHTRVIVGIDIIDGVKYQNKIGICIDTCHLNDAGYDMSKFDEVLDLFDSIIGIDKIGCIHVNDSKNDIDSHKDRHENIGFGTIGFDTLINIVYNKRLENIPKILETPYIDKKYPPYKYEIEMIRNKEFDNDLINKIIDKNK